MTVTLQNTSYHLDLFNIQFIVTWDCIKDQTSTLTGTCTSVERKWIICRIPYSFPTASHSQSKNCSESRKPCSLTEHISSLIKFVYKSRNRLKDNICVTNVTALCLCCSCLGSSGESVIGKLFGCEVENSSLCRCGKETVRSSLTLLFTMHYPEQNTQGQFESTEVCISHS